MGGYSSKEVTGSSYQGYMYDEIRLNGFKVHAASPSVLGRCFIEVSSDWCSQDDIYISVHSKTDSSETGVDWVISTGRKWC